VVEFQTSSNVVVEGVPHYGVRVSRGKLPRLETSIAGAAFPDSGNSKGKSQHNTESVPILKT
jgi:glucokinase